MSEIYLSRGQVMTLRVALETFLSDLCENGLGDDDHGRTMVEAHKANIADLRPVIDQLLRDAP